MNNQIIGKLEERISQLADEYEKLEDKNPHILMAKREFINGKIVAYRNAIYLIRAGGKEQGMNDIDYSYCHIDEYAEDDDYHCCLDYMECEECPYYYEDEEQ